MRLRFCAHGLMAALALGLGLLGSVQAQTAGEVEFARGVGFAQAPGQTPRTLGKGLALSQGDRITTSDGALAIVRLSDGSRMTVRPNSEIVLQRYQFKQEAPDNNLLLQLVRGGFRAITGAISKSSPDAAKVQTNTATIGIRGTDFDARICARDCASESSKLPMQPRPNAVQASARLIKLQGDVAAVAATGERRRLAEGGSVYPGDLVETAAGAGGVLIFRDDSRVTLGGQTRLRIDNFVFDDNNAGEGRFLASVLKGSARVLTGLIGKANNRNVGFTTSTATIGIRGTGLDIICTGSCAGEPEAPGLGLTVFTWLGTVEVTPGQSALQLLQAGQGLLITKAGIFPLSQQPGIDGQRPDEVDVPPNLFTHETLPPGQEGVYVFVRDGHIVLLSSGGELHLGRSEAGFAGERGLLLRPIEIPTFLDFDWVPMPNARNPLLASILAQSGLTPNNQCR